MSLLSQLLDADQLNEIMGQLEGYDISDININGVGGLTIAQLDSMMRQPGFQIISVSVEE